MFGVLRPGSPQQERMPMSPDSSPQPPNSLAPIPPSEFSSREELMTGTKDWAANQGYAIVIARSRANRLWLKCDRGGSYENRRNLTPDQRKRKRGDSRLLGCPFKAIATAKKDGIWRVETEIPQHNHPASDDLSAHPTLRRMTDEQLQRVHEMCDSNRSPAETIDELRLIWPDIKVLTRDIYNARKKYKTQREQADAANGLDQQQPFEDPNGVFPGPDQNGRWAWVPDGEEVTNKKKRRRRTAPAQTTLDPQLQTPTQNHNPPPPPPMSTSANHQLLNDYDDELTHSSYPQPHFSHHDTDPSTLHPASQSIISPTDPSTDYFPSPDQFNHPSIASPSRLRSQAAAHRSSAPATAVMAGPTMTADDSVTNPPGPKAQNGQVLLTRMDRMEKEQRDQKQMLAQILGAVQGMNGSPG